MDDALHGGLCEIPPGRSRRGDFGRSAGASCGAEGESGHTNPDDAVGRRPPQAGGELPVHVELHWVVRCVRRAAAGCFGVQFLQSALRFVLAAVARIESAVCERCDDGATEGAADFRAGLLGAGGCRGGGLPARVVVAGVFAAAGYFAGGVGLEIVRAVRNRDSYPCLRRRICAFLEIGAHRRLALFQTAQVPAGLQTDSCLATTFREYRLYYCLVGGHAADELCQSERFGI